MRLVETGSERLEDSGLILGAEAPLRVRFRVHNPGDAGMGLGIWVCIRWFQLPRKKGEGSGRECRAWPGGNRTQLSLLPAQGCAGVVPA